MLIRDKISAYCLMIEDGCLTNFLAI